MKPLGQRVLRFTFVACFGIASVLLPLAEAAAGCPDHASPAGSGHSSVADDNLAQPLVAVLLESGRYATGWSFDCKPGLLPIALSSAGRPAFNRSHFLCRRSGDSLSAGDALSLVDRHVRLQI